MTDTAPPEHARSREPAFGSGPASAAGRDGPTEPAPPSADSHPRRHRAIIVVAGLATALAVAAALLAIPGGDQKTTSPTSAPTATTVTPPPNASAAATTPSSVPATTTPGTATTAGAQLEDGRHPVFLTDLDVAGRSIEFDLIQFLTGDEANAAFHEDHPDQTGPVDDDYYIVNDNPRLRTLPVADPVAVRVVQTATSANAPHAIAFEALPGYVAGDLAPNDGRLWHNPFWLTVQDGTIRGITEQYTP